MGRWGDDENLAFYFLLVPSSFFDKIVVLAFSRDNGWKRGLNIGGFSGR
jgi:hypothetical protein